MSHKRFTTFALLLYGLLLGGREPLALAAPTNKVFLLLNGTVTQRVDSTAMAPKFLQVGIGNVVLSDDGMGNLDLGGGAISSQALSSGKIFLGNASNQAAQVTLTGDVTVTNAGVTIISAGAVDNGKVAALAGIAYSKLALTNSVVNADIASAAAIAYTKLALTGQVVNADIAALAAISRAKLAAGTAAYVVINDGTGLFSEEQYLSKARGGTGADNSALTFPATGSVLTDTSSNLGASRVLNKDLDSATVKVADSTDPTKKAAFDVSAIPTATSRTYAVPAASTTLVGTDSTQTLTNKTFDAAANTLSNVANANIAAGAAIAFSKLAPLATGQAVIGNAGVATAATLSGDIAVGATGVVTIQAAAVTSGKIAPDAVDESKIVSTTFATGGSLSGGSGSKVAVDYTVQMTSSAAGPITARQPVYIKSDGTIDLASASSSSITVSAIGLAAATIAPAATGAVTFRRGAIVSGFSGLTPGSEVYLSKATAGTLVQTTAGFDANTDLIAVGWAKSATEVIYAPFQKGKLTPVAVYPFTANGVAVTFTLGQNINGQQAIQVAIDGRIQRETTDWTRGANSITFAGAPSNGSSINVTVFNL